MKFQQFMSGHLVLLLVTGSAMAASDAQQPTAAELFATARSPGSVAVGAAEGNLTAAGEMRSIYYGHIVKTRPLTSPTSEPPAVLRFEPES